jgi:hypothetical protein
LLFRALFKDKEWLDTHTVTPAKRGSLGSTPI